MSKQLNPRRSVDIYAAELARTVKRIRATWNGPRHAPIDGWWQKAPAEDQPENIRQDWVDLYTDATRALQLIHSIRDIAAANLERNDI